MNLRGRAAAVLLLSCAVCARAEDAPAPPPESDADAAQAITVTARSLRGAVATTVPPEVTVDAAAIRALGAADLNEVFGSLAPEIGDGARVVLVNGQRIPGISSVEQLPPEAVSRIEVFPEKVALQYGFRPDQRVVNVVLRDRYHALTLLGRYTGAPGSRHDLYRGKVDLLRIDGDRHWLLDLDYRHQSPIFATDTVSGLNAGVPVEASGTPQHTLLAQTDELAVNGDYAGLVGRTTAEVNGRLDLRSAQTRPGLDADDAALLLDQGSPALVAGPLRRVDRTVDATLGTAANGALGGWRWSLTTRADETTRVTETRDALPGDAPFSAILLPSPGLLGQRCARIDTGCVSTTTREAGGNLFLNGDAFALPAGAATAALRIGGTASGITSAAAGGAPVHASRGDANAQANLDLPVTRAGSAIGKLSLGANGEARHVTGFGTLPTYGGTVDWTPVPAVELLGTLSHEEQAPSLVQLDEATLATPDLRAFDLVTGTTSLVTRVEGGNPDLRASRARVARLRVQAKPFVATDLSLSSEYTNTRAHDPIADVSAATDATETAFPDRFTRNAAGYLTAATVGPVNLWRRDTELLRTGLTWSTPFGRAGTGPKPARSQFQIALYDNWQLRDDVVLAAGQPVIDLLHGAVIGYGGGTPAHRLELQTSVSTRPVSANVNLNWQTATHADTADAQRLTFTQGVTLDLRVQVHLSNMPWLTAHVPWLHGDLNLSADNLLGAHFRVRDQGGAVPLAYSRDYLNPLGRTFRITLRKRFH